MSFGKARLGACARFNLCEQSPGPLSRFPVGGKHPLNGLGMRLRCRREDFFNCTRDACEGNTSFEEGTYGHLIGRIQSDTVRPSLFGRLKGQPEARKTHKIRLFELKMPQRGQV